MIRMLRLLVIAIFKFVLNLITLIAGLIPIVAFMLKIDTWDDFVTVMHDNYNITLSSGILPQWFSDKVIYIILIFAIFILILICLMYVWKEHNKRLKQIRIGESLHDFYHQARNSVFIIRKYNEQHSFYDIDGYYGAIKKECKELCKLINQFFQEKYNKNFAVCIKMIDILSSRNSKSTKEMSVITLCRDGYKHIKRGENDNSSNLIPVKGNTDYEIILSNYKNNKKATTFTSNNLLMLKILGTFDHKKAYNNTTKDFLKRYKSTSVVPIRIEKNIIPPSATKHMNIVDSYQTVAFLCVDYKKPISNALAKEITEYLKGFGDILYNVFHEVIIGDDVVRQTST